MVPPKRAPVKPRCLVTKAGAPGVLDVPWPAARDEGDGVEAPIILAEVRAAGHPKLGGAGDALLGFRRYGIAGGGMGFAGFYFDEGDDVFARCDEVDFASGVSDTAGKDAIAFQLESDGGERFCSSAALLGAFAISHL